MFSNGLLVFLLTIASTPISWSQAPVMSGSQTANPSTTQSATQTTSGVPAASVQPTEPEVTDIFLLCKREKAVRWLRAYKLDNGKCKTIYSKEGYLQVVSSATYFASCEGVLQSVRQNIEEGGFKCAPVSQVSFIELEN